MEPAIDEVPKGILRRALANAGTLLGGKTAAGVMQLATFALAARGLGLSEFGIFSMMLAQTQLLIGLATFQSNQAVVRYGVLHLKRGDAASFQALVKFTTILDMAAAIAATVAAIAIVPFVARWAGWNEGATTAASWLTLLPLAAAIATPKGMLRLFGRFDLLARHVTVTPALRLLGVVVAMTAGGGLMSYVSAWLFAGLVGALTVMWLAWREARRRRLLDDLDASVAGIRKRNPQIVKFTLMSNMHASFALLPGHVATLGIGLLVGSSAAGLMKVAQEIGTALAKPIDLINQTVYPDVARLAADHQWRRLRTLIKKAGLTAFLISAALTAAMALVGKQVIEWVFGVAYGGAYGLLLMISMATTITVSTFAIDPALYAIGRPSRPLATAAVGLAAFTLTLVLAVGRLGETAAGLAYLAAAIVAAGLSLIWYRSLLAVRR